MTTIESIKFSIKELKNELIRRTPPLSSILRALDNLEKRVDEYEYLTDKLFRNAIEEKNREIQRLTDMIIGYSQGDEEKVNIAHLPYQICKAYDPTYSTQDPQQNIEWIGVDMEAKKP